MKKYILSIFAILTLCLMVSCGEKEQLTQDYVVQLSIPSNVTISNLDESITFRVMFEQAPLKTDIIQLYHIKKECI